ncbi:MAG TPA: DUF2085 domain-containing protein [Pyrinomonadaceae bacterium]|jgi:uncharacterized membrane protein
MSTLYRALMYTGGWWCHQLPARSPHLFGAQLPLCWRCTGILLGALALTGWLVRTRKLPPLLLCVPLALLLPLDVLYNVIDGGDGDNARRLVTGLLWGFCATAAALRLIRLVSLRLSRESARPAPHAGS